MRYIMNYILENDKLRIEITSLGAHLTSIYDKKRNKELLHQPDPKSWTGQDLSCFPWVARLKNKMYTYNGKAYSFENHGLSRYMEYQFKEQNDHELTLFICDNEETKERYPFSFLFTIKYTLLDNVLTVLYTVTNTDKRTIYYGLGGHPAFKIDSIQTENLVDTSGNFIEFEEEMDLYRYSLDESNCFIDSRIPFEKTKRIEINKTLFQKYNTLILDASHINEVTLKKKSGDYIKMKIAKSTNYLTIWSHPTFGDYVAIEPWNSLPDFINNDTEISRKKTVLSLEPNHSDNLTYLLIIND